MALKYHPDRYQTFSQQAWATQHFIKVKAAYGETEVPWETKFRQVKDKLKTGSAVLIFDDETETTNIFLANDPVLKKLDE